ncbi:MAG: beta-ketothiolase BktB [Methylocystaceae bacterium]|nr:beta-ketothiolase BktB [Methylocystaceae bacterium]
MSNISDVVILDGARTAIGTFGGSLSGFRPAELGIVAAKEAVKRSGVEAEEIEHSVFGHIIPTGTADAYLSREIALGIGMKESSVAFHLNRLCGSSIQSLISAAQMLVLGDCKLALAGGAEVMSAGVYYIDNARFGQRMGDGRMIDMTTGVLADPFDSGHMGVTAERVAERYNLSREELDAYAVESHNRAKNAIEQGYFKSQIVPVEVKKGRKSFEFDTDEHVRHDATIDGMAKLKPVFKKDGVVTAGNASGINDAACAMIMTTQQEADKRGLKPRARILSYGFCGVAPEVMGLGPIGAVPVALERAGLKLEDMDVIESNEAFAAQAMAVSKDLGFDPAKVNPNGSGISLGHPVGATGSILTLKTLYELERINGRYGLMTMCIGGGQGIAMIVEKL